MNQGYEQTIYNVVDKIISKCCELNEREKIAGLMTYSSLTQPLNAVAKTCEKLGLPSFPSKTYDSCLGEGGSRHRGARSFSVNWALNEKPVRILPPLAGAVKLRAGRGLIDANSSITRQYSVASRRCFNGLSLDEFENPK